MKTMIFFMFHVYIFLGNDLVLLLPMKISSSFPISLLLFSPAEHAVDSHDD